MTELLLSLPFAAQGAAMAVDEGIYHRRRGLPRWERIGHPLDTLLFASCLLWLLGQRPSRANLLVYIALSLLSCLFITKDEPVHKRLCSAQESWLHAVLFVLHPIVLGCAGWLWMFGRSTAWIAGQLALICAFLVYQVLYWGPWNHKLTRSEHG